MNNNTMNVPSKKHRKRRNVGLLYEFLARCISRSMVENDAKKSALALKLLKKHFKPGSELYREFRLFNSLLKSTVNSEVVAGSILVEAKNAARDYDLKKLDREKSLLIRNINHSLNDDGLFFDQTVNEYKVYATIQTLLNDWRSGTQADLSRLATYENQLVRWLLSEKESVNENLAAEESTGTNRLVLKMMMKKMNEKYAGTLNTEQKKLIREFVFSTAKNDGSFKKVLEGLKVEYLEAIDKFAKSNHDKYLNNKLAEVREELTNESLDEVNDGTVTKFLLYSKLVSEIMNPETTDSQSE